MTDDFLEFINPPEHFIPCRVPLLLERITDESLSTEEKEAFRNFTRMIAHRFHFDFHHRLIKLCDAFAPLDPDSDMLCEPELSDAEKESAAEVVIHEVTKLLEECNFRQLKEEELNRCLMLQPMGGISVRVDTEGFRVFRVYYRGVCRGETDYHTWQFWRWKKTRPTIVLKKVFVLAQTRQPSNERIILKLFKDVPVENLKIVAPKITLGLPMFDRMKIGGTVAGGLATSAAKLLMAAAFSWWLFLLFSFGFLVAMVKGVLGFFNSKTKYMQICSSALYYQNLSNNTGAIMSLVTLAEEQEVKELLLGYFTLWKNRPRPLSEQELDTQTEGWLWDRFGLSLDFESSDAMRKLLDKKLVEVETEETSDETRPTVPTYRAIELTDALKMLDADWDNFYSF